MKDRKFSLGPEGTTKTKLKHSKSYSFESQGNLVGMGAGSFTILTRGEELMHQWISENIFLLHVWIEKGHESRANTRTGSFFVFCFIYQAVGWMCVHF
jgi:hypothetical protein